MSLSTIILISLGMISLILNIFILGYGYRVFKIAKYVKLWRLGWIYFLIAMGATTLRRIGEVVDVNNYIYTYTHYFLSVISAVFLILFIYNIIKVFKNITKLNKESRFMTLLKNLPAGVVIHGEDTSIIFANETAKNILEIEEPEIEGLFADNKEWHFLREDGTELPKNEYPVNRVLSTSEPFSNMIYGINHRKVTKWILCNAYLTANGERQVAVVFTDITCLKDTQIALRKSEELYRKAFMSSHDAIIISRMSDGKINSINKTFTLLSGYTDEDVKDKSTIDINIWKYKEDRKLLIDGLKSHGFVKDFNTYFTHKNGSDIHGLLSASSIILDGEEHIITSVKLLCQRSHDQRKEDQK